MATLSQLETALVNADKAGDVEACRKLAAVISKERHRRASDESVGILEGIRGHEFDVPGTVKEEESPGIVEKAKGVLEAGATTATGMTTGAVGMVGGAVNQLSKEIVSGEFGSQAAADRIEKSAMKGAEALTYMPKTETGQQYAQTVGELGARTMGPLMSITPQISALSEATRAMTPHAAQMVKQKVAQPLAQQVQNIKAKMAPPLGRERPITPEGGFGETSVGAAAAKGTKLEPEYFRPPEQRAAALERLKEETGVDIKLTKGQKGGEGVDRFEQLQWERETAKRGVEGEPLRARYTEQNQQVQEALDNILGESGATMDTLHEVGLSTKGKLGMAMNRRRKIVNQAYKRAEKETKQTIVGDTDLDKLITFFKENEPEGVNASIIPMAKNKLKQLKFLDEKGGVLTPNQGSVYDLEIFRKSINANMGREGPNYHYGKVLKGLVDDITENAGGKLYKRARKFNQEFKNDFADAKVINDLVNVKGDIAKKTVASEHVLNKSILSETTGVDTVKHLKRLISQSSKDKAVGQQAWSEIKAATIRHLQDEITKSIARDEKGGIIISASKFNNLIEKLSRNGKLEVIFSEKEANNLRLLRDIVLDIQAAPPGSVNYSNTSSALLNAIGAMIPGSNKAVAPVFKALLNMFANQKLRKKVKEALK